MPSSSTYTNTCLLFYLYFYLHAPLLKLLHKFKLLQLYFFLPPLLLMLSFLLFNLHFYLPLFYLYFYLPPLLTVLILLHSSSSTYTTPILLFYLCVYLPPLLLNLVLLLYSYNPPLVLYTSRYLTPYWWKFPFNLTPNIINTELCKQNKPVLSL